MIIFFSGTGNSLHIAKILSECLGDRIVRLPDAGLDLHCKDKRVIWVFPVYSWGVPPVMMQWIKKIHIKNADNVTHHLVVTCGDDIGNADHMWRRAIEARGWRTGGAYSVQMPNTYVLMKGFDVDPINIERSKVIASRPRTVLIANSIDKKPNEQFSDVVRGRFAWIKTSIIYPYFVKFEMSPRPFHFTADCNGCGACARVCPMHNIKMKAEAKSYRKPHWGNKCALCLACYHVCPHHAVAYGKATGRKGQKKILTK